MSNEKLIARLRAHGSQSGHEPTDLELEAADALEAKPEVDREKLAQALWEHNHAHTIRRQPDLTWEIVSKGETGAAYRAKVDALYLSGAVHLPVPVAEIMVEWGVRRNDSKHITVYGTSKSAEADAKLMAEDEDGDFYRAYKRTIIYGPWTRVNS